MNDLIPRVSVIIPSYNHGHFIGEAINSVIKQSFKDWEIIVIDNNSSDSTQDVLSEYGDIDLRILNIENKGIIAASRNLGINHSKSEYIAFLDADDLWYPKKLETCIDFLSEDYDMVCHSEKWVRNNQEKEVHYGPENKATYDSLLFLGNCISTSSVVLKREIFSSVVGFSEDSRFISAEDYDLWLRISKDNKKIGFTNEILGEYRIHADNISKDKFKNMEAITSVVETHLKVMDTNDLKYFIKSKNSLAKIIYRTGRDLQKEGVFGSAIKLFLRAIVSFPLNIKFYIALVCSLLRIRIGRHD